MDPRFQGIIAAPFTPFSPTGALALEVIERQCEKLVRDGAIGVFVCGSTGEGVALTREERQAVVERWVAVAQGRLKVIAHVGHTSIGEAASLAAHAQASGADGVSAMAPYYYRPTTVAALVSFLEPIAAAAPELPFFYYHIPSMTGVSLPMVALLEQAYQHIPTFAGLKFTHSDLLEFEACLRWEGGRASVFWGSDEWMLAALAVGATGFVGSTYNYSTPLYRALQQAFGTGDLAEAQRLSGIVMEAVRTLLWNPGLPSGKAIMEGVGIPVGGPRPPLIALMPGQARAVVEKLRVLGAI